MDVVGSSASSSSTCPQAKRQRTADGGAAQGEPMDDDDDAVAEEAGAPSQHGTTPGSPESESTDCPANGLDLAAAAPPAFDWSDSMPPAPVKLEVPVPRRQWDWLKTWTIKDVKAMRPCDTKWKKEDQANLLADLQRVLSLPVLRVDGDHVVVSVECRPPRKGFPGRLSSPLASLCGPLRANLLIETADLDMSKCQHRVLLWICKEFGIPTPHLKWYVDNRDGDSGMIQRLREETGCSKDKAKKQFTSPYNSCHPIRVRNSKFHTALDKEAKEIQKALMVRPELQWIKMYCNEGKGGLAGSFISHLYHFVECKLVMAVSTAISDEFNVAIAALVFDGFNLADKSLHNNQAVLARAHAICEEVCPGIDMHWAWKELDFTVKSVDTLLPIMNADGSPREVHVPADFVAAAAPQLQQRVAAAAVAAVPPGASGNDASVLRTNKEAALLGPKEFTYEEMRHGFSIC